jgi:hypothetical protein
VIMQTDVVADQGVAQCAEGERGVGEAAALHDVGAFGERLDNGAGADVGVGGDRAVAQGSQRLPGFEQSVAVPVERGQDVVASPEGMTRRTTTARLGYSVAPVVSRGRAGPRENSATDRRLAQAMASRKATIDTKISAAPQ